MAHPLAAHCISNLRIDYGPAWLTTKPRRFLGYITCSLADVDRMMHLSTMLKQPKIEERLPVWTALSELFLDTELQDSDIYRIANDLRTSPYSPDEIEDILHNEVAPAFSFNLLCIAGEWAPWAKEDVRAIMHKSMSKRSAAGWLARVRRCFQPKIIPTEWRQIAELLT